MNREFLVNLTLLLLINLLIKPFYTFGIDLRVQNLVGIENYGLYFALLNFSYIFQIFSDLGLQQYNSRNIAQYSFLVDKYFPHMLVLKGILAGGVLCSGFVVALLLGYQANSLYFLLFLLSNQILISFLFFLRFNISGLGHYRLDSLFSALDKLLMVLICGGLVWTSLADNFQIEWFLYAQTTAYLLSVVVVFMANLKYLKRPLGFKFKPLVLWVILKNSLPFALVVFLMTLYTRIDAVMIERLLGAVEGREQAGIYAFAYRILDTSNMLVFLFATLLLPMFSRLLNQPEELKALLRLSLQLMLVLTVGLSMSLFYYGAEISQALFEQYTPYTAEVFSLLILTFNALGLLAVFGTLLTANGRLHAVNMLFVLGIIVNVLLNFGLIPKYGAWGASLSTLCTQGLVAIGEMVLVIRIFDWRGDVKLYLQVIFFIALSLLITHTTYIYLELDWIVKFLFTGIGILGIAFLVKLIPYSDLLAVFKMQKQD